MPVPTVLRSRLPNAVDDAVALKSNVPGRWQVRQSLRMPGYVVLKKPLVDDAAFQVNGIVRIEDAWIACTK